MQKEKKLKFSTTQTILLSFLGVILLGSILLSLLSAVTDNVKKEGENIFDGKFSINPVLSGGNSACTYCPYSAVCMFEDGVCGYDVINKIPKEKLFEEMAGGENE